MRQDKRELYCFEGLVKLAISVIIYCIFIILIISSPADILVLDTQSGQTPTKSQQNYDIGKPSELSNIIKEILVCLFIIDKDG